MPTLIVCHPDGTESEHELSGELKIGRQEGNELVLTEGGVSRKHARFFVEAGKVLVEDLGSANGTYVDGERVAEPTPLTPQSQVVLGDYQLKIKGGGRPASGARKGARPAAASPDLGSEEGAPRSTRAMPSVKPARPPGASLAKRERPAPGAAPAPDLGPVLRGLTGPWANKLYPLRGKILVGRAPPAAVMLEDDSLSRKHAELERHPRGAVFLRDLGSSNGTLLNGERIGQEPVELSPGDIIQFGMVEVVYEAGGELAAPPPRRGATPSRRGAEAVAPAPAAGGGSGKRKKLLVAMGGLVGLLLVAGVVKTVTGSSGSGGGAEDPIGGVPPTTQEPVQDIQELLSQCRSYSSTEMGNEPQWEKAEVACDQALNIDPINAEANSLIKRIKIEKEAAGYFGAAEKALVRLKEEEALDLLQKIPVESQYFRRAKIKVRDALELVKSKALDDCKRYLRDAQYTAAVPRCDRYMGFWCATVPRDDLEPPLGFSLVLEGKVRASKREWQPKDKLFVQFLIARKKLDPASEPWKCPESQYLIEDDRGPKPEDMVKRKFKERYTNPFLFAAMMDYWGGRGNEALAKLQKLRSNYEMSQLHGQADELIKQVGTVDQLFKNGQALLQVEDVERAAEPMGEALELDKTLMGELWERQPSFYRRNIQQDLASNALIRGKHYADREDRRRGCKVWKLGFQFYKGNTDLNKVVGFCSTQGLRALQNAGGCEDLQAAEDFAVPGDGLEEKIVAAKQEMKCK